LRSNRLIVVFIFICTASLAQLERQKPDSLAAEREEYLFPIFPGRANLLAGSMGELRNTHFHAGLDIRTNNMTGIPVRAAKNGYVSRIIVGTHGYGKVLFVTHADGNQTIYGHLDKFKGAIANYVLKEHYAQKSFDLDLHPEKNSLLVTQGDTIALSGNTGGSQGPHLHFEIRDSANLALNPLTFNFSEIVDTFPPHASKIALVTLDSNARINDKFGRFEFYLFKQGNTYTFAQPILAHGKIGVELLAVDRMNNSAFRFGINQLALFANGKLVFNQFIDKINFEESRGIQNVFNYRTVKQRGVYFNKLYVDDGNALPYHQGSVNKGIITVDQQPVDLTIHMQDTYGNKSEAKFTLKPNPITNKVLLGETLAKPLDFEIHKNVMKVMAVGCKDAKLNVSTMGNVVSHTPSYGTALVNVYLIDLIKGLPDSIQACGNALHTQLKVRIPSGESYRYTSDYAEVNFDAGSLYDTLYFTETYKTTDKAEMFGLGNPLVPLFNAVEVVLKPKRKYQEDKSTRVYNSNGATLGGSWENGAIRFFTKELGTFTIQQDLVPPGIARIYLTQRTARFKIGDTLSGIASFEATINGEWLLMDYEYKTGILLAERLDKTKLLKGDFQLKVTDNAGNQRTYNQKIL
jgi:hypothetical protein